MNLMQGVLCEGVRGIEQRTSGNKVVSALMMNICLKLSMIFNCYSIPENPSKL